MSLNPKQFSQQSWYHGGNPAFIEANQYVHVGTRQAAEQRIDPKNWDPEDDETFYNMRRNSGLYEVRLARGATVAPEITSDEDVSDRLAWTPSTAAARKKAGRGDLGTPPEFDALPYRNEYEDKGNVSLFVNPEKLQMVRRLR